MMLCTYPCRSSGIESSINAIFSRLKPPTLKLMAADDLLLKFPLVFDNPCKSNVPNGFFIFAAFESFKFNVKFCLKRLPPGKILKNKCRKKDENFFSIYFSIYLAN